MEYTPEYIEKVVTAQKATKAALEDTVGQTRQAKYTYADLSSIMRATKAAYNDAGLAIRSEVEIDWDAKRVTATTIITDGTVTERACPISIPIWGPIMQGGARGEPDEKSLGSTVTYARRYSWAAATSVELADDENGVDQRTERPTQQRSTPSNTRSPAQAQNAPEAQSAPNNWQRFTAWLTEQIRTLTDVSDVIGTEATEAAVVNFITSNGIGGWGAFQEYLMRQWSGQGEGPPEADEQRPEDEPNYWHDLKAQARGEH